MRSKAEPWHEETNPRSQIVAEEILEAIVLEDETPRWEAAAQALGRAVQAGSQDAGVLMMLALANKRLEKIPEARQALRKIARPDADVFLQMGLLSLCEGQPAQAETEFTRARELDGNCFEAAFNLLLVQLVLGKIESCLALLPPTAAQAASRPLSERRFLSALHALLRVSRQEEANRYLPVLTGMNEDDERRLLKVLSSLGQLDVAMPLANALVSARPTSEAARSAYLNMLLVKTRYFVDRCQWAEAEKLLRPQANARDLPKSARATILNLLGVCASLSQNYAGGIADFAAAIKLAPTDPRLHQNLALAHELAGDLSRADPHWNRFFDLLEGNQGPAGETREDPRDLAFEGLNRLATRYTDQEKWDNALGYIQRAIRIRPEDFEALERLFHLSTHGRRTDEARRILGQMRRIRPAEPQLDLYELDLNDVKTLADIEKQMSEIQRIRDRHPGDARVEERAFKMVGDVIPLMGNLCDQLTDQLSKIVDQVRNLPNYQINWAAVREVMRDLLKEFQKLRRITGKCLPLVATDEHRTLVRNLAEHIDKKMEACRSLGA